MAALMGADWKSNMDENQRYVKLVINLFIKILIGIEKGVASSLKMEWLKLLNENNSVYALRVKQKFKLNDIEYFFMLLALLMEVSYEFVYQYEKIFNSYKVNVHSALYLYQFLNSTDEKDTLLPSNEIYWKMFYESEREENSYYHDMELIHYPWISVYLMSGELNTCTYLWKRNQSDSKEEIESASLHQFCSQGMKFLENDTYYMNCMGSMNREIYQVMLDLLPESFSARKLISFCRFFSQIEDVVFFFYAKNKHSIQKVHPLMQDVPYTFLVSLVQYQPDTLDIAPVPFDSRIELLKKEMPFVRKYTKLQAVSPLIASKKHKEKLNDLIFMMQNQSIINHYLKADNQSKGMSALFHGASGCGKTLAAKFICEQLHRELWQIDLSNIMDKYIGESEKHLANVFDHAEKENVVLLFDEADILFSKRVNVNTSSDRYANSVTAYLLQRMETHHGLMILTSNFLQNFDDAFLRRINFIVRFPSATKADRKLMWENMLSHVVVNKNVNIDNIAEINLSLARIAKCVPVAIGYMLMEDKKIMEMRHIRGALSVELEKQGELLPITLREKDF